MERENQMERERLGSRLGFILLSAGCAIGCGNVWKFPWMCGQFGGGGFVLIYVICLILLGIPQWLNYVCQGVILVTTVYSGIEYFAKNADVFKEVK